MPKKVVSLGACDACLLEAARTLTGTTHLSVSVGKDACTIGPEEAFEAFLTCVESVETVIDSVTEFGLCGVRLSSSMAERIRALFPSCKTFGYVLLEDDVQKERGDHEMRGVASLIDQYPDPDLLDVRLGVNITEATEMYEFFDGWTDRQLSAITMLYFLPYDWRHVCLSRGTFLRIAKMTRLQHLDFGWAFLTWPDFETLTLSVEDVSLLRLPPSLSRVTLGMDCRTLNFMCENRIIPCGTLDMRQNYPIIDILEHLGDEKVVADAVTSYRQLAASGTEICMGFCNENEYPWDETRFRSMAHALAEALHAHGFSRFICSWNQAAPQDEEISLLRPELAKRNIELVTDLDAWDGKWYLTHEVHLVKMLTGFEL